MSHQTVICIAATSIDDAVSLAHDLPPQHMIEFRLDYLPLSAYSQLSELLQTEHKILFTVRTSLHGGKVCSAQTAEIKQRLTLACQAQPNILDIESDIPNEWLHELKQLAPNTQFLRSHHNLHNTPSANDLTLQLNRMQHPSCEFYKIITTAECSLDALRLLHWRQQQTQLKLVAHAMGDDGQFSRVAGVAVGNIWTYVTHSQHAVVSAGLSLSDANHIYQLQSKNNRTRLFALLGDPVAHSIGYQFHNHAFHENNINALYIHIRLTENDLQSALELAHALPFDGFSVTMPLKKSVLPHALNPHQWPAINTLTRQLNAWRGDNTDGAGAVSSMPQKLINNTSSITILGSGSAAEIIALSLQNKVRSIIICSRRKPGWVTDSSIAHQPLTQAFPSKCKLLINTIPDKAYREPTLKNIVSGYLRTKPYVIDINYHVKQRCELIKLAADFQCTFDDGKQMFYAQAERQQYCWQQYIQS